MREFSGMDYLRIDIANQAGLGGKTWDERIAWVRDNEKELESKEVSRKTYFYYLKAVNAYRASQQRIPVGHIMYLDATASGLQIMAILSGCEETALQTNLIDPSRVYKVYEEFHRKINNKLPDDQKLDLKAVKKAVMTHFYGKRKPAGFNPKQEKIFFDMLSSMFQGPKKLMQIVNQFWNPNTLSHEWRMPDSVLVKVPVMFIKDSKIEVDELGGASFTYRHQKNIKDNQRKEGEPSRILSLVPNIVHSLDAYIAREVVRKCFVQRVKVVTIFDAFGFHPGDGNVVRKAYLDTLIDVARKDTLQNILSSFGLTQKLKKRTDNLHVLMNNAEYPIC